MPVDDSIFEFGKNIHALASYYLRKENIDKLEKSLSAKELETWLYLKAISYFSYQVIGTEYEMFSKIGKYFCGGRLDALLKNNEEYYILDYKTGSVPKNAKYDFQTMIYMLAVSSFYKTNNIKFVFIDLKMTVFLLFSYKLAHVNRPTSVVPACCLLDFLVRKDPGGYSDNTELFSPPSARAHPALQVHV